MDHRDPEVRLKALFDKPGETRRRIAEALAAAPAARGTHGNIPL